MSAFRYPRPAILERIPRDRHAVIEASAGTGKTFTLEHLVVDLLLEGARIEQILVVTFTERATAELRARIRAKLEELVRLDRDVVGERTWLIDDAARARLQAALSELDAATISTIHGFCQRVLGEHAFEGGRLFNERQVDAEDAFEDAFLEVLRTDLASGAHKELLELWLESVGDVRKLQDALRRCVAERGELRPDWDPEAFLGAVANLPGDEAFEAALLAELDATKLHGATKKALRTRLPEALALFRSLAGRRDAARMLVELRSQLESLRYLAEKLGGGVRQRQLADAVNAALAVSPAFEAAALVAMLEPVRARLVQRKREQGLFDFDDMLQLVHAGLHGPRGDAIAELQRQRYQVALVDEFQDTDQIQWEIFKKIFCAEGRRLYVIGDPKQAIYAFRGADVHTYLAAREELAPEAAQRVQLTENFRSTAPMIAAVNTLLDQAAPSPFFTGRIRYDAPVSCGRPEFALTDTNGRSVPPVEVWQLYGRRALVNGTVMESVARELGDELERILRGPGLWLREQGKPPRRLEAGDCYVLTRKDHEARELGRVLRARGIPVAFFKQEGLFQTPEARHVRDVLAAIAAPGDLSARRLAWLTPFFALGLDDVARSGDAPPEHPLMARLLAWRSLAEARDYEQLFARLLDESGLVRRELLFAPSERELTNYEHLFELLLEEVHRSRGPVEELVRALDSYIRETRAPPGMEGNLQRLESDGRAVQLMTMHKSKGLEAPVVFLAGGFTKMSGRAPALTTFHDGGQRCAWIGSMRGSPFEAAADAEAVEEDQRLLYVALTRAKARLYLPLVDELDPDDERVLTERLGAPPSTEFRAFKGAYQILNARLAALRASGELVEEQGFARKLVRVQRSWEEPVEAPRPPPWTPPAELLAEPPPDERPAFLRKAHAGFVVTSYSRMSAARAGERGEEDNDRFKADLHASFVEPGEHELPPGAATGVFIHEVLELLPLDVARAAKDFDGWSKDAEPLVRRIARRHGIDAKHVGHALQLAWNAVRTPLALPDGSTLEGIAAAARVLREVEFLYPIPEAHHPLLARGAPAGEFTIARGCVKGFIDLIVEHQGRACFADWKSDLMPSYQPAAIAAHVAEHYAIQEQLYSLALARMLGIRSEADFEARFGGSLYLFLRGLAPGGGGVHARRPTWKELVQWEQALLEERDWGVNVA